MREYLRNEAAGGAVLMVAAVVALVWATSPGRPPTTPLWETRLAVELGRFGIEADLRHWIDDGLMTIFFPVVGLEIKRELVDGELRTWRRAALPVVAAAGGMAVPALIYAAANAGGPGAPGWGVPMATDIAFALGVLALLGSRVPAALKVFLLTITAATWLAVRLGLARLPDRAGWAQLTSVATVAGIGFTVPLIVADLAFPDGRFQAPVKLGLLLASVVAGVAGALVLLRTGRPSQPSAAQRHPGGPERGGG